MSRHINIFHICLVLLLLFVSGCSRQDAMQRYEPEHQAFVKQYIGYLSNRDIDEIIKVADPGIQNETLRGRLLEMADLIPNEPPISTKLIYARVAYIRTISSGPQTMRNMTFEYEFSDKWILFNIITQQTADYVTIIRIRAEPQTSSQEELNRFRLSGKSPVQYATLLLACAFALFTVYALVLCIKTRIVRRKWLWILFILFGVGKFAVNWTTGVWQVFPLSLTALSASVSAPLGGPWTVTVSLPLGAIVFLARRKRLASYIEPVNAVTLRLDTAYVAGQFASGGGVNGLWFTNTATRERLHLICTPITFAGNMRTKWSGTKTPLDGSPHTALQKAQLQSLFDHVYHYACADVRDNYLAGILSNVIYAILYSTDADGNLLYRQIGDRYYFTNSGSWNTDASTMLLIESYVSTSRTGDWSAFGYEKHLTDVTFYDLSSSSLLAGRVTSPFFHVEFLPEEEYNNQTTASTLIPMD